MTISVHGFHGMTDEQLAAWHQDQVTLATLTEALRAAEMKGDAIRAELAACKLSRVCSDQQHREEMDALTREVETNSGALAKSQRQLRAFAESAGKLLAALTPLTIGAEDTEQLRRLIDSMKECRELVEIVGKLPT